MCVRYADLLISLDWSVKKICGLSWFITNNLSTAVFENNKWSFDFGSELLKSSPNPTTSKIVEADPHRQKAHHIIGRLGLSALHLT